VFGVLEVIVIVVARAAVVGRRRARVASRRRARVEARGRWSRWRVARVALRPRAWRLRTLRAARVAWRRCRASVVIRGRLARCGARFVACAEGRVRAALSRRGDRPMTVARGTLAPIRSRPARFSFFRPDASI